MAFFPILRGLGFKIWFSESCLKVFKASLSLSDVLGGFPCSRQREKVMKQLVEEMRHRCTSFFQHKV